MRHLVDQANTNRDALKGGGMDAIREFVDGADVVIGVYQEKTQPHGVGTYIIKGRRLLMTIAAEKEGRFVRQLALGCTSLEEAVALQWVFGEPDAKH